MNNKFVMALDEGTTSVRCILYDRDGNMVSQTQSEFKQIYPQKGWVEQDAMEIWSKQLGVAQEAIYKINGTFNNIDSIGITNQRETTVVWDKETGEPIYNAIVWQCRRTADFCMELKEKGLEKKIREKTGLIIDPYFSATKLKWILDNVKDAKSKAKEGKLLFGTIDTWLLWKLTGGKVHVTDYSNASRTMMYNIHTLEWDDEILDILDIPRSMLPKVKPSSEIYGYTNQYIFGGEIPISGIAGDQQASLFGQACFDEGHVKMTYGTGGFMLANTGKEAKYSNNGLLTTIAWGLNGSVNYALEGSIFVAGSAIQWLRDELNIITKADETEAMARSVNDSNGVVVVPAFAGLGAPYWDPYARGMIHGLSRGSNKNHIVRATLESLAFQTVDLVKSMEVDLKDDIRSFKVDGGASANNFLMEFQANILDIEVKRSSFLENTSLGAAYLAGLATGFWESIDEIKAIDEKSKLSKVFKPSMSQEERTAALKLWHKAVEKTREWSMVD